jgi:hypothetical protein
VTDILIPIQPKTVYCVGVKQKGSSHVHPIAEYQDHLTALKLVNRFNCTKGLATGDLYVLEEVQKA